MNRSTLFYLSLCLFYLAVLLRLTAPRVGFYETHFEMEGLIDESVAWPLAALALAYSALAVPINVRVIRQAAEKIGSYGRLAVLTAAFALIPGSIGIGLYFLSGSPYVSLPFYAFTALLTAHYYLTLAGVLRARG